MKRLHVMFVTMLLSSTIISAKAEAQYAGPNLLSPMPAGHEWLVTTRAGGSATHQNNGYHSVDLDDLTSNGQLSSSVHAHAAAPGSVSAIPQAGCGASTVGYGCVVKIDHGNGYETTYGHLVEGTTNLSVGQAVSYGHILGEVGTSGNSTGTHLHFEIRHNNNGYSNNSALQGVTIEGVLLTAYVEGSYYLSTNQVTSGSSPFVLQDISACKSIQTGVTSFGGTGNVCTGTEIATPTNGTDTIGGGSYYPPYAFYPTDDIHHVLNGNVQNLGGYTELTARICAYREGTDDCNQWWQQVDGNRCRMLCWEEVVNVDATYGSPTHGDFQVYWRWDDITGHPQLPYQGEWYSQWDFDIYMRRGVGPTEPIPASPNVQFSYRIRRPLSAGDPNTAPAYDGGVPTDGGTTSDAGTGTDASQPPSGVMHCTNDSHCPGSWCSVVGLNANDNQCTSGATPGANGVLCTDSNGCNSGYCNMTNPISGFGVCESSSVQTAGVGGSQCPPIGYLPGQAGFCTSTCPCDAEEGNCTANDQCSSGLVCDYTAVTAPTEGLCRVSGGSGSSGIGTVASIPNYDFQSVMGASWPSENLNGSNSLGWMGLTLCADPLLEDNGDGALYCPSGDVGSVEDPQVYLRFTLTNVTSVGSHQVKVYVYHDGFSQSHYEATLTPTGYVQSYDTSLMTYGLGLSNLLSGEYTFIVYVSTDSGASWKWLGSDTLLHDVAAIPSYGETYACPAQLFTTNGIFPDAWYDAEYHCAGQQFVYKKGEPFYVGMQYSLGLPPGLLDFWIQVYHEGIPVPSLAYSQPITTQNGLVRYTMVNQFTLTATGAYTFYPCLDVGCDMTAGVSVSITNEQYTPGDPATVGCADGTAEQVFTADMVGCNGTARQNESAALCAAGWQLAPYSVYTANGGDTTVPNWSRHIASCLIDNQLLITGPPTNATCSSDVYMPMTSSFQTDWSLSGVHLDSSGNGYTGIISTSNGGNCYRVGHSTEPCIYARSYGTFAYLGAVCVRSSSLSGGMDAGVNDGSSSSLAPATCLDGTAEMTYANPQMVGCYGNETQLNAGNICGSGSHLCTLDEYAARGGATNYALGSNLYWVASCLIDDAALLGSPTQLVCSSDVHPPADITAQSVEWSATGLVLDTSGNRYTGVVAKYQSECRRLGTDVNQLSAQCTYTANYGTWAPAGAMCCASGEAVDGGVTDGGTQDSGTYDAGSPATPATCDDGSSEQTYTDIRMVGCAGGVTQTNAAGLCGSGSHVCTLDEYAERGGASLQPSGSYWLAACLIDNGTGQGSPSSSVCSSSSSGELAGGARIDTDWTVGGTLIDTAGNTNTGVIAYPTSQCHRLGNSSSELTSHCTYAQNYGTWAPVGTMCCTP